MDWKELLDILPEEIRPLAEKYVAAMGNLGMDEIESLAGQLISGDDLEAYRILVKGLSTADLIDLQEQVNHNLNGLNEENASLVELQQEIVLQLVTVGLAALKARVLSE